MKDRKQNTTVYPITFLLVSSGDHVSPVTGASPAVTISKNGGAFEVPVGTVSEIGSGWYALAGDAGDRDTLGTFLIHAEASGADPSDDRYDIVAWDPYCPSTTPAQIADAFLARNLAGGLDGGRTVRDSLRFARNRVVITSDHITVYAEDDTTIAWEAALVTDHTAAPITAVVPS